MRFFFVIILFLIPSAIIGQEQITKSVAGPSSDGIRVLVAVIEQSDDAFKTRSMIVDLSSIKRNTDTPDAVLVDLTSTVRTLPSGKKDQKILQLRWDKDGTIEMRCGGKWQKSPPTDGTREITETTKNLIGSIPLKLTEPVDFALSDGLKKKILAVLDSLSIEAFPCLRTEH